MCTLLETMQIIMIIRGAAQDVLERRLNNQYSPRKFRLPSRLFRLFISINKITFLRDGEERPVVVVIMIG